MKAKKLPIVLVLAIGLLAGIYFLRPHSFHGTVIQSSEPAFDFTLTSADGDVSLSDYRGKIVLLYFGYTFCPDICPATLGNTGQAIRRLNITEEDVQLIMISLDPERDTPQKLATYVAHFHPSFVGVTGSQEQLNEVASLYGIFYEKVEGSTDANYIINHTATLLVIDREGYLKLIFPFGVSVDEIADDLGYMLSQ